MNVRAFLPPLLFPLILQSSDEGWPQSVCVTLCVRHGGVRFVFYQPVHLILVRWLQSSGGLAVNWLTCWVFA
jgi:hypothetical protein